MAESATVARPYAKALFALASEGGCIDTWLEKLKELAWSVEQASVAAVIDDASLNANQKADILLNLLFNDLTSADLEFKNFVYLVAQEKRLQLLPEIYAQYQIFALHDRQVKKAVVYSAYPMSEGQFSKVLADCRQQFGNHLEATLEIVPNLIGGIRVEVGDQVLDLSVQGKLQKLYAAMTN